MSIVLTNFIYWLCWFILNINKYFNNSIVFVMFIQIFVLSASSGQGDQRGPDLDTFDGSGSL